MDESRALRVFSFKEQDVRVVEVDGEPWWVAKDVCDVLGLGNPTEALRPLDEDEKSTLRISEGDGGHGGPERNIISESGLYTLILRSNKAEARPFRRWVTHEVLPSLRRNGFYAAGQERGDEAALGTLTRALSKLEARVAQLEDSARGGKYQAELMNSASRQLKKLPPAPPFTRVTFFPISYAFDKEAQEFMAERLIGIARKQGERMGIWRELKGVAKGKGWKIGSTASFYRFCTTFFELFPAAAGIN